MRKSVVLFQSKAMKTANLAATRLRVKRPDECFELLFDKFGNQKGLLQIDYYLFCTINYACIIYLTSYGQIGLVDHVVSIKKFPFLPAANIHQAGVKEYRTVFAIPELLKSITILDCV